MIHTAQIADLSHTFASIKTVICAFLWIYRPLITAILVIASRESYSESFLLLKGDYNVLNCLCKAQAY